MSTEYDVVVVGGGIVGLATARALVQQRPGLNVVLLEKEQRLAVHQTGRNSGVVHSGIYYAPGSLKARYAKEGLEFLQRYCPERGIAYEQCGKVIVATDAGQVTGLDAVERRAADNGIPVERLNQAALAGREPHAAGVAALLVRSTGIVDYVGVCAAYRADAEAGGAEVVTGAEVLDVDDDGTNVTVTTSGGEERTARMLVNCAGLHSDRVARLAGLTPRARILPFRGEYYELSEGRRDLVRHLIYPVPDPSFPFLGVHLTRDVHGGVHAGPNAVLALAREGYTLGSFSRRDVAEIAPALRLLAPRAPALADGSGGVPALPAALRLRGRPAAAGARGAGRGPGARPRRRAGAGGIARRLARRRLPHRRDAARAARAQRALASRHSVHAHRERTRGPGTSQARRLTLLRSRFRPGPFKSRPTGRR